MIVWVGATTVGSIHDKRLADAAPLIHFKQPILADLGFQGLQKVLPDLRLPHKKPKNGNLTDVQKAENQALSAKRVSIEHVFAEVKILRIVKEVCRCKKRGIRHQVFQIACALHNFRLFASKSL